MRIGDNLHISVLDIGQGFAWPQRNGKQGGMGLPMIRERLEDIGGCLTIQSRPGKGTCVRITLPLNQSVNAQCGGVPGSEKNLSAK